MKHTSGPWHRNIRANGKYPVVFAGRNQHIATAAPQKDSAETEANISLLSAAPELLDALVLLLPYAARAIQGTTEGQPLLDAARAAITKATGDTA